VESLNGIETVKAFNAEDQANLETEKKFVTLLKSIFKIGWLNNLQSSLTGFAAGIGGIIILWFGAYQVIQGKMSLGQLLTFNALLAYFLDPIKNLINLQPMMQTAIVASDRLGEILDLELEKAPNEEKKICPATLKGTIEFKNVDFRYGTEKLVLKNINMTIEPGQRIALVGESGSGKTTLVKLIMNFYPWEKGDILINGYNIKDINLERLRDRIAYISQDIFLFSGMIQENLCLGNQDLTLEEIVEAAKITKTHDFVDELPLRYDTMLEENGANLSGGQKQRLAITRAILKNPDILIMDEATSNLDSITEMAIEKTIHEFSRNITTIIIAHRLSTIMRCDKIYVMDKGEFVESGTHQQLMNQRGRYYELWKEQLLPANSETGLELA
jgi:ATP-binding cassette subfamily B protein